MTTPNEKRKQELAEWYSNDTRKLLDYSAMDDFKAGYEAGHSDAHDEVAEKAEADPSVIIAEIETLKLQNLTAQAEIIRLNRIIARSESNAYTPEVFDD